MTLKKWLWEIAIKKALKRAVQAVVSLLASQKITEAGITIDETLLTTSVFAALEFVRNWAKNKLGWGWL